MPKVSEQYRLDRRDEIVEAALRAFRRKGFQATSMAEIIAESGLSAGAIYGHFAGKSEIVLAVATKIVGARVVDIDNLTRLDPMPEPGRVIRMLLDGLIESIGQPAVLVQVWGEAATDPALLELCVDIFSSLQGALAAYLGRWHQMERGLTETRARQIATDQVPLFLSAIQGFVLQDSLLTNFDRERYLTKALSYLPK